MPNFSAVARAKNAKGSVHIVTVGFPFFSNLTESWTLHVVQDPQSPIAAITKSEVLVSSSIMAALAEAPALGFWCQFI